MKKVFTMLFAVLLMVCFVITPALAKELSNQPQSTVSQQAATHKMRNVLYYGDWSIWKEFYPQNIPADKLTHLNYAFLDFDSNGNLVFTDKDAAVGAPVGQPGVGWDFAYSGLFMAFQQLRAEHPNLKIGISVGGWSKSGDFSIVSADPQKRANLIHNIIKLVDYANMDFVDYDWEYPVAVRQPDLVDNKNDEGTMYAAPEDKENFVTLLEETRAALDQLGSKKGNKYYELSVAIPASKAQVDLGIDVEGVFRVVDFANIMTYDMGGAWNEYSGHHTALYTNPNDPLKGNNLSVDDSVKYYIQNGARPEQIVVGAAYYTRGWAKVAAGTDSSLPGLFQKAEMVSKDADQTPSRGGINEDPLTVGDGGRAGGVWSYKSLDKLKATVPGLVEYWDDVAKAPYLYNQQTGAFFTYDNVRSIQEKASYVVNNNLGGMIAWMASQDAASTDPTKRDELTTASKEGMFGNGSLPVHEITYKDLDVTVNVKPYQESNVNGYEITIINNEKQEETDTVLRLLEIGAETIKLPKLYIKSDGTFTQGDYLAGTVTNENGYTLVDLSSVYDAKTIGQGKTYTLKINGTANIEQIELVQRLSDTSPEVSRQTVYGELEEVDNQPPVISGVSNQTIQLNQVFHKLAGVTAADKEDGDLTDKLEVTGEVNTSVTGEYTLVYNVADSQGAKTSVTRIIKVIPSVETTNDFGVGKGTEWPSQVFAPFVDMVAWITKDNYNIAGVANLAKLADDTGVLYYNLGFIQSAGNTVTNGKLKWGWGGLPALTEGSDHTQYDGIKKSILKLREKGGDVTISLGGLNGTSFWQVTQDVDVLYDTYMEIVTGYGLTQLDLDIEGSAQNLQQNIANAKAIKKLQDATGVKIILTVPVMPFGLTIDGTNLVDAYLNEGVDIKLVNIMAMCYGPASLLPEENYGTASLRAVESTVEQLKSIYRNHGITLTEQEAYAKLGTTISIGFESSSHPIFTTEWTQLVVNQGIAQRLGMVSFWSINRDAMLEDNAGVSTPYAFTNIFKQFTQSSPVNQKPIINGAANVTIKVGDNFNILEGVTAIDLEDGNITSTISYTGQVDTLIPGIYTIIYTVTDSKGLTATVTRIVTVEEAGSVDPTLNEWDSGKIYLAGDIVSYQGKQYKAKWWVQGQAPGTTDAWERLNNLNPDGSENLEWDPLRVYNTGDVALYHGERYVAKWWVQGEEPDKSLAWEKADDAV